MMGWVYNCRSSYRGQKKVLELLGAIIDTGNQNRSSLSAASPVGQKSIFLAHCFLILFFECVCLNCYYVFSIVWKYYSLSPLWGKNLI